MNLIIGTKEQLNSWFNYNISNVQELRQAEQIVVLGDGRRFHLHDIENDIELLHGQKLDSITMFCIVDPEIYANILIPLLLK